MQLQPKPTELRVASSQTKKLEMRQKKVFLFTPFQKHLYSYLCRDSLLFF